MQDEAERFWRGLQARLKSLLPKSCAAALAVNCEVKTGPRTVLGEARRHEPGLR